MDVFKAMEAKLLPSNSDPRLRMLRAALELGLAVAHSQYSDRKAARCLGECVHDAAVCCATEGVVRFTDAIKHAMVEAEQHTGSLLELALRIANAYGDTVEYLGLLVKFAHAVGVDFTAAVKEAWERRQ